MIAIIKDFLVNPIVANWIAPIVVGLILLGIPAIFSIRKDNKKIYEANRRYLDAIRPYVIQKINISDKYIVDVREAIIKEVNIKDKYVYQPVELKNKLILDITESNYINENDKKELLDFTYDTFKQFKNERTSVTKEPAQKNPIVAINNILIVFIVSLAACVIMWIKSDASIDLTKDTPYELSFVISFVSFTMLLMNYFISIIKSRVSDRNFMDKIKNIFFETIDETPSSYKIYNGYTHLNYHIRKEKNRKNSKTSKK